MTNMTLEEIWNKTLIKIEEKVGNNILDLWFRPIKLTQLKEQHIMIDIPNRFFKDWIEDNYPDIITESVGSIMGYPVSVRYRIAEKIDPDLKKLDMRMENRRQKLASKGIYLNPKYTFEHFIVGSSNQFAQAAARAVADAPGKETYLYGAWLPFLYLRIMKVPFGISKDREGRRVKRTTGVAFTIDAAGVIGLSTTPANVADHFNKMKRYLKSQEVGLPKRPKKL